jgi:hypothetical protein
MSRSKLCLCDSLFSVDAFIFTLFNGIVSSLDHAEHDERRLMNSELQRMCNKEAIA